MALSNQLKKSPAPIANNMAKPAFPAQRKIAPTEMDNVFASAATFEQAMKMAGVIANSTLVPDAFKGKPANCMLAIEMANRMGISAIAVMQNAFMVKGKLGWSGQFVIATINASRRYKTELKFKIEKDQGGRIISCMAYAAGHDGEIVEGPIVTAQMVSGEGWGSNSKWQTMPDLMYRYRAGAFFGRTNCPDLLLGLQTVEELEDVNKAHTATVPQEEPVSAKTADEVVDAEIEIVYTLDMLQKRVSEMGLDTQVRMADSGKYFLGVIGEADAFKAELSGLGFKRSKSGAWVIDVTEEVRKEEEGSETLNLF